MIERRWSIHWISLLFFMFFLQIHLLLGPSSSNSKYAKSLTLAGFIDEKAKGHVQLEDLLGTSLCSSFLAPSRSLDPRRQAAAEGLECLNAWRARADLVRQWLAEAVVRRRSSDVGCPGFVDWMNSVGSRTGEDSEPLGMELHGISHIRYAVGICICSFPGSWTAKSRQKKHGVAIGPKTSTVGELARKVMNDVWTEQGMTMVNSILGATTFIHSLLK